MRTTFLVDPDGSGGWGGLLLDVDGPARPDLRIEVASGRRMLMRQEDRPLLFTRIADGYRGVDYLRAADITSPIAPCRADRARALAEYGPDEAIARWARTFADELATTASGPLHRGRWIITRYQGPPRYGHLGPSDRWRLLAGDHGYLNWFTTPSPFDVVALRTPSALERSRVKAYRKQAREGTLPPVLLWWISGLACHVMLDGHDRFVAALAEDREPAALVLALQGADQDKAAGRDWAVDHYTRAMANAERAVAENTAHPFTAFVAVSRRLGEALHDIDQTTGRTRAWPLPGGATAWQQQATAVNPRWPNAVAPIRAARDR